MSNLPSRRQLKRDLEVNRLAMDAACEEAEKWRGVATVLFRRLATEDGTQVRIPEDLRAETVAAWEMMYGTLTNEDGEITGAALMCVPREEEPTLRVVREVPDVGQGAP